MGCALFAGTGCDRKSTPDWNAPETAQSTPAPAPPGPEAPKPKAPAKKSKAAATSEAPAAPPTGTGLRFISYNLENWLTMERQTDKNTVATTPKPEKAKQAAIRILVRQNPDVLGICEIGTTADLAELRESLKAAGLDLPHSHHTGGSDPVRHLGLLSRFPITATAKPSETEYQLAGQTYGINRGILDATIAARGKTYRFLGVHLKSRRDTDQGDQQAIRLGEARLLRRHVDSIFETNADARLIVYGDFNETRAADPLKLITGKYGTPTYLTAIPMKDSHQEAWTHYWELQDVYSRFDFIMVSKAIRPEADFPASKIIDDPEWSTASDHRPVMAVFK